MDELNWNGAQGRSRTDNYIASYCLYETIINRRYTVRYMCFLALKQLNSVYKENHTIALTTQKHYSEMLH